jgi:hypothetical protein
LEEVLKSLIVPPEWKEEIVALVEARLAPKTAKPPISRSAIEAQLGRLALVYTSGDIDEETYHRQRAALKQRLDELGAPAPQTAFDASRAFALLDDLADLVEGATESQQRAALRKVFATIWVEPHQIVAITPTDLYAPLVATVEDLRAVCGNRGCPTGDGTLLPPSWQNFALYWTNHRTAYRP